MAAFCLSKTPSLALRLALIALCLARLAQIQCREMRCNGDTCQLVDTDNDDDDDDDDDDSGRRPAAYLRRAPSTLPGRNPYAAAVDAGFAEPERQFYRRPRDETFARRDESYQPAAYATPVILYDRYGNAFTSVSHLAPPPPSYAHFDSHAYSDGHAHAVSQPTLVREKAAPQHGSLRGQLSRKLHSLRRNEDFRQLGSSALFLFKVM